MMSGRGKEIYYIAIAGAGASGLAACIEARKHTDCARIVVLEKNDKPAKKLYATGNGRCNLLNKDATFLDYSCAGNYSAREYAESVFERRSPERLRSMFEDIGIELVEEEGGRLYPASFQASSVVKALNQAAFSEINGKSPVLINNFELVSVRVIMGGIFELESADGRVVHACRLILAGGGKAGIQYGSDGRCLKIAESLGHSVIKPIPALVGINCDVDESLAGTRARALARLYRRRDAAELPIAQSPGEVQFQKGYISGICVMDISGKCRFEEGSSYSLSLDFMPDLHEAELELKLEDRFKKFGSFFLDALLPAKLATMLESRSDGDAEKLARLIKDLRYEVKGTLGWPDAQLTSGGVALNEIKIATMESLKVKDLYFAGEMLDMDGPCGGYNLSWAFATGSIAGECAAMSLRSTREYKG